MYSNKLFNKTVKFFLIYTYIVHGSTVLADDTCAWHYQIFSRFTFRIFSYIINIRKQVRDFVPFQSKRNSSISFMIIIEFQPCNFVMII